MLQPVPVPYPTVLQEGTSASVGSRPAAGEEAPEGESRGHPYTWDRWLLLPHSMLVVKSTFLVSGVKEKKIFMQESDASNFLKRRGKRSPKSQDEVNGKEAGWSPSHNRMPKPSDIRVN